MQKLIKTIAISSLVFGAFTINAATEGAADTDFNSRCGVRLQGPGLATPIMLPNSALTSMAALQEKIRGAYDNKFTDLSSIQGIIDHETGTGNTIATDEDVARLCEYARVMGVVDVRVTGIASSVVVPGALPGLPAFVDEKDLAKAVTINDVAVPAYALYSMATLYEVIRGVYDNRFTDPAEAIRSIVDTSTGNLVTADTIYGLYDHARVTPSVNLQVTLVDPVTA